MATQSSFRSREKDALAPISPYGVHKQMGEELCSYYNRVHGYHIRCVRIFSAYGSGLRKQLLWDIYQKYLNTGRSICSEPEMRRVILSIFPIFCVPLEVTLGYQGPEEIFNVANGEEVSIRELAEIYAAQLGEKTDIVRFNGETKVGDPQNWRADISLLKKIGYEKKMDLTEGIREYVGWVKQQA